MSQNALVLAGGGVAGIAWELGVLLGLRDGGVDVTGADLIIGTSAGANVGAQICSNRDLVELYDKQLETDSPEIAVVLDVVELVAKWGGALEGAASKDEARAKVSLLSLEAATVSEAARRNVIAQRLPSHEWSSRSLLLTAVDSADGSLQIFDRSSGVSLVDAVAASCAVPFVWPAVTINGRRYIDGGIYSGSNASLAKDADKVLILSPSPANSPGLLGPSLEEEIATLKDSLLIAADDDSIAAFGANPLDAATRRPSALAGRAQGLRAAAAVAEYWS